jgi:AraC-like DNA-binding protein
VLLWLFQSQCLAQTTPEQQASILSEMPAEELKLLSERALKERNRADSALYYSMILANKFTHKQHLTAEERYYTALAYNRCGYLYMFYLYDYANAVDCLIKADKYCDNEEVRISLNQNMGHLYSLYAVCFPSQVNIVSARNYYRKAFNEALERKDWRNVVSSFINFWNFGLSEANLLSYEKEVKRLSKAKIPAATPYYSYAQTMLNVVTSIRKDDYEHAETLLKEMMTKTKKPWDDRLYCYACWHLASVYKKAGQLDSALHYSLRLEEVGRQMKLKDVETDADKLLAEIYLFDGNDKATADGWQLAYFRNRDSLLVNYNLNIVKNNHLLSNVHNLAHQVGYLQQQRRAQNQLTLVIVAAVILTSGFLVLLFIKNKQLKKQNLILYRKTQLLIEYEKPKYQNSSLDEVSKSNLKAAIELAMVNTEEICSEDFSLERLAQLCHAGKREVSQVINEKFGQSFVQLLSEYRVHEACRRINDVDHSRQLTLEAIGMSVGFKARESFSRAFKRVTGLSPSDYQKIAYERNK